MEQHTMELIGMVLVAVITALVGPAVLEYVKVKLSKSTSKDIVRDDIERNMVIFDEISEIRETLDADRIWVSQFHNGGHFLHTNKSIQKFSITYEDVKPGVSSIIHLFTDIPLSLYSRAMNHIMENKHLWITDFKDETNVRVFEVISNREPVSLRKRGLTLFELFLKQVRAHHPIISLNSL